MKCKVKAIKKVLFVSDLPARMAGALVVLGLVVVGRAEGFLMTRVDPGEVLRTVGQSVELLCQVWPPQTNKQTNNNKNKLTNKQETKKI